ncbi:MAG TPA: hypothetical protein PKK06_05290 [Phycisphaerae bacterium]|nr:hypothetical protein [Phycisphaerae bacterium]HNU44829.1 hypothetical protein [Phycisphaerae bacterium]
MKTFTDTAGRTWTLALTIDAAKRVKGLLGVNLLELDAGDPPLLTRLGTDVILLCDVIFALVKPQADAVGVSDEQFAAALGGDAVFAAQTAFYEELMDFFRKLGRTDLAKAVDAQRRMIDLAVARIETRIDKLDLEAAVSKTLSEADGESTRGGPSTNSPPSSVSTPAR